MPIPSLDTARLTLEPWRASDIDALHALWTDACVRRWLWDDVIISREQAESTVLSSISEAAESDVGMWCVRLRGQNEVIGFCGFRFIEDIQDVELMYGLLPSYWGRGFATEAARAVVDHGFEADLFDLIHGRTDLGNRASARVLERIGMRFERQIMIRDLPTLCYSLRRR